MGRNLPHLDSELRLTLTRADLKTLDRHNVDPRRPVRLVPVFIPKPWGQEVWYTGIEARGESRVQLDTGEVPLSAYLAQDTRLISDQSQILLLKVLDPKAVEARGELYFEVHEAKQEVYVVTHIDADAWPGGQGGIRFGMNQEKRAQYASDEAFRSAYLERVEQYRNLRRAIDEDGEVIESSVEAEVRSAMNAFTHQRPLNVGDVVQVPTWTPHSLLHGVRVVEFQTPTYERYIISFSQQVLTQEDWDSRQAITHMRLNSPEPEIFEQVAPGVERIARFSDFNVWRVDLDTAQTVSLPATLPYAVCMTLQNPTTVGPLELAAEQACFIPHLALNESVFRGSGQVLIAAPNL